MKTIDISPLIFGLIAACSLIACGESDANGTGGLGATQLPGPISLLDAEDGGLPSGIVSVVDVFKGDFNAMAERRLIRALIVPNRTAYFFDGVDQKGTGFEALKLFEEQVNKNLKTGRLGVYLLVIPTTRDRLIPDLLEGYGDIAAANLTITPERQELVEFTNSFLSTSEIIVSGPKAPQISSFEDLAGQEVFVRRSSSYWESLERLNAEFDRQGKKKIRLKAADEILETEDVLEMVNAGLVPITVADSYLAEFWGQIFDNIKPHPELAIRTGGEIAWAFRKNSPELEAVLNRFVKGHKKGTLTGNILYKRYYQNTKFVRNSLANEDYRRFEETMKFFQEYAGQYDFDWLMIAAQGYQESRLDQSTRSKAGAIGVMQLLKSTANDPNVAIPNIEELEPNIHAGVKYLRFLVDHYFDEPGLDPVNRHLFGFASYNAGPNRIQRLRKKTAEKGLDPNVWFRNVEVVVAHDVGREPVRYVSNIYKYYLSYRLLLEQERRRMKAKS